MRKLILFNMVTVDGYFEGPNREIDWHRVDGEFNEFAEEQLNSMDGILFGRVTYQLMSGYWPTETAIKNDPVIAKKMNEILKFVFSKSLDKADWNNTRLIRENIAEEVAELKQQPGKDLFIFGSSNLCLTLMKKNLIDESRIMVNPVVLGKGNPLFKGLTRRVPLKFLKTRTFMNGNVLLYYQLEKN